MCVCLHIEISLSESGRVFLSLLMQVVLLEWRFSTSLPFCSFHKAKQILLWIGLDHARDQFFVNFKFGERKSKQEILSRFGFLSLGHDEPAPREKGPILLPFHVLEHFSHPKNGDDNIHPQSLCEAEMRLEPSSQLIGTL